MLCYAILCCTMLCYAMLYYAVLCYAMLCYARLGYAMLICTMLYHAVPCQTPFCGSHALSEALHDNTAATAPRETDDTNSAISTASLKATRPGRRSMNADGASGAGCSQRPAGTAGRSTDTDQSALRHQRGGDNPNSGAGGLPSPGTQTLISGSGHGIRVLSRSHTTDSEESLDFFGVAHKGSALKVSRGSNLSVSGANIHMRGCAPSGSGKAKPVAPIKRFTVLQDNTPAFHCGRLRSGGDRVHSSHTDPNTKVSRCKRSLYTPGLRKEHPGQASGTGRLSQPTPSGSASASPGVPALPGTPIITFACPGENGRFGHDHSPARAVPPDQRVPTEKITTDGAAEQQRAPSHLAFPHPKAQNAARSAAVTPGQSSGQRPRQP